MNTKRYFIGRDNSGHRYLVDAERQADWLAWSSLPEDDEAGWDQPSYARRLDGTTVIFENPKDDLGNRLDF